MNKELLNQEILISREKNPGLGIVSPGEIPAEDTADHLIDLLQTMYVEHGIVKNKPRLIEAISSGDVLTWFVKDDDKFVATASLVKQSDNAWELGRAVSTDQGNGIGKRVILEALKFHIENHSDQPLTVEVRAAEDFEGIPSGMATQKIFFGLVNSIVPIVPYAIAPLFAHGKPLRNEQFVLSSSDVKPGKTISNRLAEVLNNRSFEGETINVQILQREPFQLIVPSGDGINIVDAIRAAENFNGCTLFPIETTDRNMPLIQNLSSNLNMVICGIDRVVGKEGKPVVLIATLGNNLGLLAPTHVSEVLPTEIRQDIQNIANKFTLVYNSRK